MRLPHKFGILFAFTRQLVNFTPNIIILRRLANILKWTLFILLFWAAFAALCYFVYPQNKWIFYILILGLAVLFAHVFTKLKHKLAFFASAILLLSSIWLAINYTPFQNFLIKKVAGTLSKKLKTKVEVKHVDFSLFNKMLIEGVLVEDKKKDTLLYAGTAKVNITDWFFMKDEATLHYVGLSNTVVNLNRTDSVWNYQFIVDYFDSPSTGKKKKKGLQLDLKVVEIENLRFNKIDGWIGKDLIASVGKLDVDAKDIDFDGKKIDINTIKLVTPLFAQNNYTGNRDKLGIKKIPSVDTVTIPTKYKWNNDEWVINVKEITLKDGTFKNDKETERLAYTDKFDGQHLLFTNINGSLKNVQFLHDTVSTNLSLTTKERSGFEIKKIDAFYKLTPDMMEFNQLDLVTNKSRLSNYYVMRYNNFNDDMSDFLHSVRLEGKFENSKVHSDDIAIFAPNLKTWNRQFDISGNARGTIDNLVTKNILIKSGNTTIDGDIALRGLPDINNTFIDFKSRDLKTTYGDLVTIIPSLKKVTQPQLSKLGNIRFKGNYVGFINDFVAYGDINTNLGNINADINMKLPEGGTPIYSGKIITNSFNLGSFLNTKTLGNITVNGKIKGKGFTASTVNLDFDGTVKQVQLLNYNYQNLTVKGTLNKKLFKGNFDVNDPNLVVKEATGIIDFNDKNPSFNLDGFVQKANLQKLGITNDDFAVKGKLNLNFKGKTVDNFLGDADISDALVTHNGSTMSLTNFHLSSTIENGVKTLAISSNDAEGTIKGDFNIEQLPNAFSLLLNKYYPSYFKKPTRKLSNQNFSFDIKTKQVDEYVQLLDKRLKGFNNATFNGSLKIPGDELTLTANIPEFSYDGKTFVNTQLNAVGTGDTLTTIINVDDIGFNENDSLHLPQTQLKLVSAKDITSLNLTTSASKTLSDAKLNASIQTLTDGVKIKISPSSFILNDKKWNLEKDGELTISQSTIGASEIKFTQGEQAITIFTKENDITGKPDVVADLKNVNINDFTPFIKKIPRLEGLVNGTVTLEDPFGKPFITFEGDAENFVFENNTIGKIKLKTDYNTSSGLIRFKANTDEENYKFDIEGDYNTKDSLNNNLNLAFLSERFKLSLLETYLGTIFSNMDGNVVSDLKINAGKKGSTVTGSTTITDGSLKVNYTQVTYKFNNETIIFNPDEIDLGTMVLKDTMGNNALASGKMYHNFFQDFEFDNVRLNSDRLLLLNTTKKDNSQFYGKVIGNAKMKISGPITDMRMDIDGEPSLNDLDSNHIYIPSSTGKESGGVDYIEFIQFGTKMEDLGKGKQGTNILVNMDLKTNPTCKIDVILDEETGDIIKGRGNGNLKIRVGTKENMSIRGIYNITGGEYTFNFQTFLQKYFTITGGTINWNGDPYKAAINIKANYLAKNVDVGNIISSKDFKQKENINILSTLTGELQKPIINFEFVPEGDLKNDYIAQKYLDDLRTNPNEMNKQIVSVLLFNSFINDNQNFLSGNNVAGLATNTIGGIVSNLITSSLNKQLERATNGVLSVYADINAGIGNDLNTQVAQFQANLKAGFKILLSSRFQFIIGGTLDYNNPYAQLARRGLITPDLSLEWLVNKNGSIRVVGFNRTSTDLNLGQRNRTGVSLTYRKDFNKLSDLFKGKKKAK
ncbi:MAG: translocation/assembly module TamB domain-containing protein [Ferruginibacter sp.]|nr:translocation/assembly module TamB domain-containing protein [Ferruginibacter sp.]